MNESKCIMPKEPVRTLTDIQKDTRGVSCVIDEKVYKLLEHFKGPVNAVCEDKGAMEPNRGEIGYANDTFEILVGVDERLKALFAILGVDY